MFHSFFKYIFGGKRTKRELGQGSGLHKFSQEVKGWAYGHDLSLGVLARAFYPMIEKTANGYTPIMGGIIVISGRSQDGTKKHVIKELTKIWAGENASASEALATSFDKIALDEIDGTIMDSESKVIWFTDVKINSPFLVALEQLQGSICEKKYLCILDIDAKMNVRETCGTVKISTWVNLDPNDKVLEDVLKRNWEEYADQKQLSKLTNDEIVRGVRFLCNKDSSKAALNTLLCVIHAARSQEEQDDAPAPVPKRARIDGGNSTSIGNKNQKAIQYSNADSNASESHNNPTVESHNPAEESNNVTTVASHNNTVGLRNPRTVPNVFGIPGKRYEEVFNHFSQKSKKKYSSHEEQKEKRDRAFPKNFDTETMTEALTRNMSQLPKEYIQIGAVAAATVLGGAKMGRTVSSMWTSGRGTPDQNGDGGGRKRKKPEGTVENIEEIVEETGPQSSLVLTPRVELVD